MLILVMLLHSSAYGFADLSEVGIGARPLALGRAYTALSSDGSGIFTNPAGLADFPKVKVISMMGRLIEDVNYVAVGAANSFPFGTAGIGYISAGTQGIPLTTLTSTPTGAVISAPYAYTDYNSSIYYFSYSRKIFPSLQIGSSLKYFSQNFSLTAGSMEGGVGSGTEMDFGAKWHPIHWLSVGCLLKNALPASMGGKFIWDKNKREEALPMSMNLGTNIKVFGLGGLRQFRDQNVSVMIEAQSMPKLARSILWKLGTEWWITRGLALRGGIDQDFKATSSGGTEIDNNLAFGVGLKAGGFNFDYAYHQYGELKGNISHFFSLGYIGFDEDLRTALRLSPDRDGSLVPFSKQRPEFKKFIDVDDSFWAKDAIDYMSALGIMDGFPDNTFKPDQPLTRAQIAVLLVKAKGFDVASGEATMFYDLPAGHWAAPYVNVAVKRKYIAGYPDTSFQPARALTRAEGVAILSRFAGLLIPAKVSGNPYMDVEKSAWYAAPVAAAKNAGLLEFISEENFEPNKLLIRAEAAEIISKTKFGQEKIRDFLRQ